MEKRKDIVWYEWLYQVSDKWNIKSLNYNHTWKEKILKKWSSKRWYYYVVLSKNKKTKTLSIHRLVAKAFILNKENKPEVNHKNWIKGDNKIENLERCTKSENSNHSIKVLWNKCNYSINPPPMKWKFGKDSWLSKPILQYNLDWYFIKEWASASDAGRWLNVSHTTHITACCKLRRNKAYWFIWKYKELNSKEEKRLGIIK